MGTVPMPAAPVLRWLGRVDYEPAWRAMQRFNEQRQPHTADEIWFLEHPPVFTMGMNARSEHLLAPGEIPVVNIDRGGQVTYHGPGQLVCALERAIAALAGRHGIEAAGRRDAPGVYVDGRKLASLGLRVRHGACYHGLALNVDMDLEPFGRINPCGYAGLEMTQLSTLGAHLTVREAAEELAPLLCAELGLGWEGRWAVSGEQ